MTSPTPEPIRIEVPTAKVDATLDLVGILESIASNAETAMPRQAGPARAAAALPADAVEELSAIGQLARDLATKLAAVGTDAPEIRDALEQASSERSQ